jgi:hypothetical protein
MVNFNKDIFKSDKLALLGFEKISDIKTYIKRHKITNKFLTKNGKNSIDGVKDVINKKRADKIKRENKEFERKNEKVKERVRLVKERIGNNRVLKEHRLENKHKALIRRVADLKNKVEANKFKRIKDNYGFNHVVLRTRFNSYITHIFNSNYGDKGTFSEAIRVIVNAFRGKHILIKLKFNYFDVITGEQRSTLRSIIANTNQLDSIIEKALNMLNEDYVGVWFNRVGSDIIEELESGNYTIDNKYLQVLDFIRVVGGCNDKYQIVKLGGNVCVSYKSQNNNCLIEVLKKNINKNKLTSDKIRENLKFNAGPLTIEDLKKLEKYYMCSCKVFKYDEIEKSNYVVYEGSKSYRTKLNIMQNNGHYMFLKQTIEETEAKNRTISINKKLLKEQLKEIDKNITDFIDVQFDFETVTKKNGKLMCYKVAIKHKGIVEIYPKTVTDIEKVNYENDEVSKWFLTRLIEINNEYDSNTKLRLIGYNNSKFDNFLFIDELLKNEIKPNILYVKNSILKMKTAIFETFDLCRFTMCSLKDACNSFKLKNKKVDGFDHSIPQKEYQNENLKQWIINNNEAINQYCKMDVESLDELYNVFRKTVKDLADIDITDHITIAGAGMSKFKKQYEEANILPVYAITDEKIKNNGNDIYLYDFIKRAQYAGRSQMFKVCSFNEEVYVIDATSLYPFVMKGGDVNLNFECYYPDPLSKMMYTNEYKEDKEGFYFIDIIKQPIKNIIPLRSKEEPLNWEYDKEIKNIVATAVDIRMLKKYGADIIIYNGVYWEGKTKEIFKDYVELFEQEKKKQDHYKDTETEATIDKKYNPSLREATKLFINALSGKCNEGLKDDAFIFTNSDKDISKFSNTYEVRTHEDYFNNHYQLMTGKNTEKDEILNKNKCPHYLGVYIYSHARRWMYDNIISKSEAFGMDTDSYFMKKTDCEALMKENPIIFGSNFGQFKIENHDGGLNKIWDRNYFAMSKSYGLYSSDPMHNKTRFKGVKKSDKYITEEQMKIYKKIKNAHNQCTYYNTLPDVHIKATKGLKENTFIDENFFKKLLNKESVYLLSSMFKKEKLSITAIYMVKQIRIKT